MSTLAATLWPLHLVVSRCWLLFAHSSFPVCSILLHCHKCNHTRALWCVLFWRKTYQRLSWLYSHCPFLLKGTWSKRYCVWLSDYACTKEILHKRQTLYVLVTTHLSIVHGTEVVFLSENQVLATCNVDILDKEFQIQITATCWTDSKTFFNR